MQPECARVAAGYKARSRSLEKKRMQEQKSRRGYQMLTRVPDTHVVLLLKMTIVVIDRCCWVKQSAVKPISDLHVLRVLQVLAV